MCQDGHWLWKYLHHLKNVVGFFHRQHVLMMLSQCWTTDLSSQAEFHLWMHIPFTLYKESGQLNHLENDWTGITGV